MSILANFNLTGNTFKVKKMTSPLNTGLIRLSSQNLPERSLKDHLKPEIHLHFQVSLKISKMAYFAVFHLKSP